MNSSIETFARKDELEGLPVRTYSDPYSETIAVQRKLVEEFFVYGTPWNGKHRLGENICAPLKAICILDRDIENQIRDITLNAAYPCLSGEPAAERLAV